MNPTPAPYRFYAFEVSYFSAKVRPALRYKQLWYEELRADIPEIRRRTGLGFIPILITPEDETWQDSTEIFEQLEARHPDPPLFPPSPVQRMAAQLVELYVDEFGTIPAMHYRWGSQLGESSSRARFTAMIGNAQFGKAAADRMVEARRLLGATDATAPAIEAHTRELLDALGALFERQPYLLGSRMCFGDCALMGPLYAHFFNDLVSRRLLLETALPVVGWIERCNFPNPDGQDSWLGEDSIAAELGAVLETMGRDAAPVLLAGVRAFEDWADQRPAELDKPPRAVGMCRTELRGLPLERFVSSYTLWMLQHTLAVYRAFDAAGRQAVDKALAGTGWDDLLAYQPRHRLCKRGFELAFDPS